MYANYADAIVISNRTLYLLCILEMMLEDEVCCELIRIDVKQELFAFC